MIDPDIHLVTNVDDIPLYFEWLTDRCRRRIPLAVDTETTALHPVTWRQRGFVRLWQVGDRDTAFAIPAQDWHRLVGNSMELIRLARVPVIFQNAKYDLHAMEGEGWVIPEWDCIHDTEILSKLGRPWAVQHGLKPTASDLFGEWAGEGQRQLDALKRATGTDWATVPIDHPVYWGYGCLDTVLTRHVWDELAPKADPYWYEVEMEYQRLAYGWERHGLRVDVDYLLAQQTDYEARIRTLEQHLLDLGLPKPGSNKALEAVLEELGYEFEDFTAKGNPSLDKAVMERLTQLGGTIGRVASKLMQYRRTTKWKAVYVDGMLEAERDGRVHPFIRTMGAKTGRSSITDPPLQTIPKDPGPRGAFLADEGKELWPIDYDSQEQRINAALADERAMIEMFEGPDPDIHRLVANMAGIDRNSAKTLNYARGYGAGVTKLAIGAKKTEAEMEEILAKVDATFPRAAAFMQEAINEARANYEAEGYAYVTIPRSGRRVGVDLDKAYTALNYKIQGHGADVLKLAALRLDRAGYGDAILLPVHDELLLQFPVGEGAHYSAECAEIMLDTFLSVRLTAGPEGPFSRWGEKYEKKGK